jgi:anaerobic ribonucleoside-triphosphate reductase activating protein
MDQQNLVIWVTGCSHQCPDCLCPELQDINTGSYFEDSVKQKLLQDLVSDDIQNIIITGGDPFHSNNIKEIACLIEEIKRKIADKKILLYGRRSWEEIWQSSLREDKHIRLKQNILRLCDVYIDGACEITGSNSQRYIDVKLSLKHNTVVRWCE